MKTALIISGGEYCEIDPQISYDYLIACDKGAFYAQRAGLTPDVIIGDFDSYEGRIEDAFPAVKVLTYPVRKDDTDTMLCIKHALSLGYNHILIVCALGNRMDHTIANLQSMYYIASHGGFGEIWSKREHLRTLSPLDGEVVLQKRKGFCLSLFALSEQCTGLRIHGAEYSGDDITLTSNFPLGHGNGFAQKEITLSVASGHLLIVESAMEEVK